MSRWDEALLKSMRQEVDPVADACVKALFEENDLSVISHFHDLIDEAGRPREGLPPSMVAYLEATGERPSWMDPSKLAKANEVLDSHGLLLLLLCGCASLPECYTDRLGMPVLFLTQKLNSAGYIDRRIAETILFVKDVLTDGGFAPTGAALDAARKVRLMHAAVRYLILHTSDDRLAAELPPDIAGVFRDHGWEERLGKPINQEDLAFTLQTFAWVIVRGLRSFDVGLEPAEEEAIIHAWNVAGHALGIREDLLPRSVDEAEELFGLIKSRLKGESEAGVSMTTAVMTFAEERIPWKHFTAAPHALSRYLIGDATADLLGMQKVTWRQKWAQKRWVFEISLVAHVLEDRMHRLPFARRLAGWLFQALLGHLLERRMKQAFEIPTSLADHWSLNMPSRAEG